MLELTLLRHANTAWNTAGKWQGHSDVPLSELGRAQAQALGVRLRGEPIDALYTSDLLRAVQTAELALGGAKVSARYSDRRLREVHFGAFEGATQAENQQRPGWAHWQAEPWSATFPHGESLEAVARRMRAWADGLAPQGRVVAVSHGLAIRALLWSVMNWPAPQQDPAYPFGFNVQLPHASLTRLRRGAYGWQLMTLGDAAHLEAWSRSGYSEA